MIGWICRAASHMVRKKFNYVVHAVCRRVTLFPTRKTGTDSHCVLRRRASPARVFTRRHPFQEASRTALVDFHELLEFYNTPAPRVPYILYFVHN